MTVLQQDKSARAALRVKRYCDLEFKPRFEYGHMAQIAEICSWKDGTELGTGFARFENAYIPWTIQYDEMLTVLEGVLRVHAGGEIHELQFHDSIWLPTGTELVYESDKALVAYAIHPSNWNA